MNRKSIIFIISILVFFCISGCNPVNNQLSTDTDRKILKHKDSTDYKSLWDKVNSDLKKGLPKSSQKKIEKILYIAKKKENTAQIIKALIYKFKCIHMVKKEALVNIQLELKKEIKNSQTPVTQILHSIAAEYYWNYYRNNRYKFYKRSKTIRFKNTDIRTWDLTHLISEIVKHQKASLTNIKELKRLDTNIIREIIHKGNTDFRPTLYDFIAHRAADFFSDSESGLTKPEFAFTINKESYFSPCKTFTKLKLESEDKLSFKFSALEILQNLIKFHLNDDNPDALIDVNLKRLKFVYNNSVHLNKEDLYIKSLIKMYSEFKEHKSAAFIKYQLADFYNNLSSKYNRPKDSKYRWYKKKAADLCIETIKMYRDSKGAINCKQLLNIIKVSVISIKLEKNYIPQKPFRTLIKYRNVNKLFLKIIKTSWHEKKFWKCEKTKKTITYFNNKKPVRTMETNLKPETDYQEHSAELPVKELNAGRYIILLSNNKDFNINKGIVAFSFFKISNIAYLARSISKNEMGLYIFNRDTGAPLKKVSVQIWYSDFDNKTNKFIYQKGSLYYTDQKGYTPIKFNQIKKKYFKIQIITETEKTLLERNFYKYHYDYNRHRVRKSTVFFTDRAIYRPGQTVYFKAIHFQTDNINDENIKILPHNNLNIAFYDVNRNKISDLNLKTNEFGTVNGSFNIPEGLLNGRMSIECDSYSKSFYVEEYKRPKFKILFKKNKNTYRLNDLVSVKGSVKAFSGYNIDKAKVRYRIIRRVFYPYKWYFCQESYTPLNNTMEIKHGTVKSDEKGEFIIKFRAKPDLSVRNLKMSAFTYTIKTDVTDINGETHTAQKDIKIGYRALKLNILCNSIINKDPDNLNIQIHSTNLSGEFSRAQGKISIYLLKSPQNILRERFWDQPDRFIIKEKEYRSLFPHDIYKADDKLINRETEKKIFSGSFDTGQKKAYKIKNTKKWKKGIYRVEVHSKDKYNNKIKDICFFTLYSKESQKPPVPSIEWLFIPENTVKPGQSAEIILGTSCSNTYVLFEKQSRSKPVRRKFFYLNNEQKIIKIPVTERDRGNINISIYFFKYNRVFKRSAIIHVPWSNKKLQLSFESFRNKLIPGEKEEWKIKIKGPLKDKIAAEMVTTLYDKSLDTFNPNIWKFSPFPSLYAPTLSSWSFNNDFNSVRSYMTGKSFVHTGYYSKNYDRLNWFGFYLRDPDFCTGRKIAPVSIAEEIEEEEIGDFAGVEGGVVGRVEGGVRAVLGGVGEKKRMSKPISQKHKINKIIKKEADDLTTIISRKNFNETAFFYPDLNTNKKGEVIISFRIPEALTKWRMIGFAHTKDLKYGFMHNELQTRKELMVIPNPPRFLRENDKITFTSKIKNLTKNNMNGNAKLMLFDAKTMKPADMNFKNSENMKAFTINKEESTLLKWELSLPEGIDTVTWRVVAQAGKYSDGEENVLPVLKNRMLVTESLPLPVRSMQTKVFRFKKLINSKTYSSLKNHKLTLEFTSNPVWYAVQALPYMMEYPYECSEQTFSRYYANTVAAYIVNQSPHIKKIFNLWKKHKDSDILLSNLEKNHDLKNLLLQETPWVLDAKSETEQKKRVALLFDMNRISKEMGIALKKLEQGQMSSGAWPWFKGMLEDRYITQHIVSGLAHMNKLKVLNKKANRRVNKIIKKALAWLDFRLKEDYSYLIKNKRDLKQNHLRPIQIHFLYARSYYKNIPIPSSCKKAFEYYKKQSTQYWLDFNKYMQGMIALFLNRYEDKNTAVSILKSIKEHALYSEETGMYWKETYEYNWYRAKIERHALLIEAFSDILNDKKSVSELKTWLLKNKQVRNWKTTKATADACYALLLNEESWLKENKLPEFYLGSININPKKISSMEPEAGAGYFKTSWKGSDIKPDMGNVRVKNNNKSLAWGSLYWQYFEDLDKITPAKTPLHIKKELFVERNSASGPQLIPVKEKKLNIGDKINVRIEIRVDRDMEYVHMKDMRASCFEPVNVISKYKCQDGIDYYESTKDASTNFFIDLLKKGTYVFEYPLLVTHKGDFSNGITTVQCMYAPEFTSHSKGVRVKIK